MQLPNPIDPKRLSAPERLDEIADLLAAGLMRLRARQSTHLSVDWGESRLDFSASQRGHVSARNLLEDAS
jgi:hypothetical protein